MRRAPRGGGPARGLLARTAEEEPLQGQLFGSELGCSGAGQDRRSFYWCLWSLPTVPEGNPCGKAPGPCPAGPRSRGQWDTLGPPTVRPAMLGRARHPLARTGLRLARTLHLSPSCFLTSGYSCCFFLRCVSPWSRRGGTGRSPQQSVVPKPQGRTGHWRREKPELP